MPKAKPVTTTKRPTTILYLRVSVKTYEKLHTIAKRKGWPNTIASVAGQAIERGMR